MAAELVAMRFIDVDVLLRRIQSGKGKALIRWQFIMPGNDFVQTQLHLRLGLRKVQIEAAGDDWLRAGGFILNGLMLAKIRAKHDSSVFIKEQHQLRMFA